MSKIDEALYDLVECERQLNSAEPHSPFVQRAYQSHSDMLMNDILNDYCGPCVPRSLVYNKITPILETIGEKSILKIESEYGFNVKNYFENGYAYEYSRMQSFLEECINMYIGIKMHE